MSERNFFELLQAKWDEGKFVCVGLDSEYGLIPWSERRSTVQETICQFNRAIVDATRKLVCAYKPNIAFYERFGPIGLTALSNTIGYIQLTAPEVPVILDAKRADIGNTSEAYAKAVFEYLEVDAVTVNPYLGQEALQPFLDRTDKGIFVLCRTSNSGSDEFQNLPVMASSAIKGDKDSSSNISVPLYAHVARRVSEVWNQKGNCGLVVGATYPGELARVREVVGDMPILIPGIGAQGGNLEATVRAGVNSRGQGMIINSSRGIIFASKGMDFAEVARIETLKLHEAITNCLKGELA